MSNLQFSHDVAGGLPALKRQTWRVGALCLAISDHLQARFNPVLVRGEISGFIRAASGHCYFTLKDEQGQLRVAMFKRAVATLNFNPQDGQQIELSGRLGVYEQRGELQLVAESMTRVGQGNLLEVFMRLKDKLEAKGLFDPLRKRPVPNYPRAIGVVTSSGAAAWHDVMATLNRRVPHIPVVFAPALVQGADAPAQLIAALQSLYGLIDDGRAQLDVILLVRGGGSLEDLWAFNDEQLAYTIAQSPVPVISGVGHETDFSITDFVADTRAPTPTAAAELSAAPVQEAISELALLAKTLKSVIERGLEKRAQSLDGLSRRLLLPREQIHVQKNKLDAHAKQIRHGLQNSLVMHNHHLTQAQAKLALLHPQHVLNRGFAWVIDETGQVVNDASTLKARQALNLHLAKGERKVMVQ